MGLAAGNRRVNVEILFARENGRRLKINDALHRRASDLLGLFYVINLSPEDVAVVVGAPRQRRRFLNSFICQISSSYWASLLEYRKIIQHRNVALRSRSGGRWRAADDEELEAWAQQLAAVGARIIRKRGQVLKKLTPEVERFHQKISEGSERITLMYKAAGDFDVSGDIEEQFQLALERNREKELKFGMTLVGPHRDDLVVTVNGMDLRIFGSQGQHRTAAIALKLAAARFLQQGRGEQPILLLDDVFAELDQKRTSLLFDVLTEFGQIFIATAKESDLAGCGENLRRMIIADGTVTAY
jgi:DNA replication and repair protein RecF